MRFQELLSLVLSFVSIAQALRFNTQITPQAVQLDLKNFLITNIYTRSIPNAAAATSWTQTLSFLFTDPNSNTSSICTNSWTQSNSSGAPLTYSPCDNTGIKEVFQWHFTRFSSLKNFTIEFMHGWDDPADFPAPYEYVGMFSGGNTFNLTCAEANGLQECYLPLSQGPYHAVINALTN